MTATEELRRLLDERGVEWSATVGANGTIWTHWDAFNGQRIHAMDNEDGTVEIFDQWDLTPEQAIAATLGRGTLTADDVRDLIERHSDASGGNGRDFHNGAYVAIADELKNTKLQEQGERLFDKTLELGTENDKLRELVLTLYMCSNIRCGRCKYGHGNTCDFDAENELRELGVEVDGWTSMTACESCLCRRTTRLLRGSR